MKKLNFRNVGLSKKWKTNIAGARRVYACAAIVLAGLLTGCSSDDKHKFINEEEEEKEVYGPESGKVSLRLIDGASQEGRIKSIVTTKAMLKSASLTYVATIKNPAYQADNKKWSATAIAVDREKKRAYITWHSDRQATHAAEVWGGAVDVIDISNEDHPKLETTALSIDMKFNHVLVHGDKLFLAATSAQTSGAIGRLALTNGQIPEGTTTIDRIGFPGVSVNAVAPLADNKLIAVSGHSEGTYGTFVPEVEARPYYYGTQQDKQAENVITLLKADMKDFGGKYVVNSDNEAYVLRNQSGKNAEILKVTGQGTIPLDTPLISSKKYAETYDYNTGEWILTEGTQANHYGKHTLAVKDDYAYVAAGINGLRVYDLQGNKTWTNKTPTIGLCTDYEFLYASTVAGLRIYKIKEGGKLELAAFEVKTYNEQGDGAPTSKEAAETGNTERHSPNFVAVNNGETSTYIYIAYGQSGVRVYKFTPTQWEVDVNPYEGVELEPEFGL